MPLSPSQSSPMKRPGVQLDSDGCLIKRVLKEGSGEVPSPKSFVSIHYEGYLASGVLFDSSVQSNAPLSFQLGAGSVVEALEMSVATMRVGEEAEVVSTQKFAFGKVGLPPFIPPNQSVILKIQLLSFSPCNNSSNNTLDFEQYLSRSSAERIKGNEYFQSKEYKKAIRHYIKAIWLLQDSSAFNENSLQSDSAQLKELGEAKIKIYLNIAICQIKLGEADRALSNCEKILELGGNNNAKCHYRMGQAYALNKQFDSAKRSLVQAIRLEPNDTLLRDELESIKKEQQEHMK